MQWRHAIAGHMSWLHPTQSVPQWHHTMPSGKPLILHGIFFSCLALAKKKVRSLWTLHLLAGEPTEAPTEQKNNLHFTSLPWFHPTPKIVGTFKKWGTKTLDGVQKTWSPTISHTIHGTDIFTLHENHKNQPCIWGDSSFCPIDNILPYMHGW